MRIRLVFEDRRILSKYQKKQGLTRSWVVLNSKCQRTVSEFSDHLFRTFNLFEACPHGLTLSVRLFLFALISVKSNLSMLTPLMLTFTYLSGLLDGRVRFATIRVELCIEG